MLDIKNQYGLYTIKETLDVSDERVCCRASDPFLGSDVILQLLKLPAGMNEQQLESFEQQLEKLAELEHPALAPIFDIGRDEDLFFYTTTFYPQGGLLESLFEPLEERDGLQVIKRLAEGLTYANGKGFEHGMIDSDEVFADEEGLPVLTNFGVGELLETLYGVDATSTPAQVPSLAQKQSTFSLGTLFLALVLPQDEQQASPVDQLVKLRGYRVKKLLSALLGMTSDGIPSYDELIRSIDDILNNGDEPDVESEQVIELSTDDEVDFSRLQEAGSIPKHPKLNAPDEQASSGPSSAEFEALAQQRDALLTAQQGLQEQLEAAVSVQQSLEQQLNQIQQELEESQAQLKEAQIDRNVAQEILDNQEQPRHPAVWLVGGFLVGMLAVGGMVYGLFNFWPTAAPEKSQARVSIDRKPLAATVAPQAPSMDPVTAPQAHSAAEKSEKKAPQTEPTVAQQSVVTQNAQALTQDAAAPESDPAEASQVVTKVSPSESAESAEQKEAARPNKTETQAEQPAAAAALDRDEIYSAVRDWGEAWSQQDLESYFDQYSVDYQPGEDLTQEQWRKTRQQRISRPAWIKIELEYLDFKFVGEDLAQIKLQQKYRSDSYGDETLKQLSLVREGGGWKIWMERSLD